MAGILNTLFGRKEEQVLDVASAMGVAADAVAPAAHEGPAELAATPVHVTDDTFKESVLDSSVPVLVDFWAPWCGPCRMIAPIVEELAEAYAGRAVMAKINTDENVQVAQQLGIMGIPTLILFQNGKEVDRVVGFSPRRTLEDKLDAVLG
jgi:thioredoxin 1